MRKLMLLAAGAVGYVLGTRAGRERYEQIKRAATKVKEDPRVQQKAQQATDFAKEQAPVVADKVKETAGAATQKATEKVRGSSADESIGDGTLNPDRLKVDEETGPRGDLP
jgi:hypothetical protein